MWHTSLGERTLTGAEAYLVAQACHYLIDTLSVEACHPGAGCDTDVGVELFDGRTICQRIALVDQVSRHLLSDGESALPLSAELEATVMAIFETIKGLLDVEIDEARVFGETSCEFRSVVLAAYEFACPESDEFSADSDEEIDDDLPDPWCEDSEHWDWVVESLADRVLMDRDFEMASMIVDEEPEMADAYKQVLGIDQDYFASAPPEVNEDDALEVVQSLQKFLGNATLRHKP